MHLIPPHGRSRKWNIRVIIDGRARKIPGDEKEDVARRIGNRVQQLILARQNGDPPPPELQPWIRTMRPQLANRLVELGLIPARHIGRHKSLSDWVPEWEKVVQGRKPDSQNHAPQQARKVRRLITVLDAKKIEDFEADVVVEKINAMPTLGKKKPASLATSTRRAYGIAAKDFAAWLAKKLKIDNPLADMEVPGQYENPEYERQPLTVRQFQMLMNYLDTFERYRNQKARWTAYDRKLIYWTAVKSGYREGELMKLRRWNLYLDEKPAVISLKPRDNKNRERGEVPIPRDLATALKRYVVDLEPNDKVFPFPETSGSIVDMLRKDLDGAGIPWELPSGEVIDFHCFRATFITWALDVDGLRPKRVQVLARLKSLSMVSNYSRNLRIEDFDWLDKSPKLVGTKRRRKAG